jgi:hypothetical protein
VNPCAIDHLVVTAASLDAGARYVREALGVELQAGGEHPQMGTHNLLLKLGDATYLEVIAVNPAARHPGRPRWFGLDDRGADGEPRLATWVSRSGDIRAAVTAAGEPLGTVETMRRGDLEWQITIPANGAPPLDGVAPALIEWPAGRHPAARLVDAGCRLIRLELFHSDPTRVSSLLGRLGLADTVVVTPLPSGVRGHIAAHIDTPSGGRVLKAVADRERSGLSVTAGRGRSTLS